MEKDSQPIEPDKSSLQAPADALDHQGDLHSFDSRNNPACREMLVLFQNAEWEKCRAQIEQFLTEAPEDPFLLAFRDDVEVRIKLQDQRKRLQELDSQERRKRWIRASTIGGLAVIALGAMIFWAFNAYTDRMMQIQLEQQATQTAIFLDAQYQNAENFMKAGRPQEALNLYLEIQQTSPDYFDVSEKIILAQELVQVESLYQQAASLVAEGKKQEALSLLLDVETRHPKYKDTPRLIETLQAQLRIEELVVKIEDAYILGDWQGVVDAYEEIRVIDPFVELPEVKDTLFQSYRNLIIEVAGSRDATLEDVEAAERYYRFALGLFPQDKERAAEREELNNVAVELLASKYYLYALALLQGSDYSLEATRESIRILTKADNIGAGSPVIRLELEKAQLYVDAYNYLLMRRWDDAIDAFNRLYAKDDQYASGRIKYMLYEAHTARGDLLFLYGDFQGAFQDYQEAEKYAWSDGQNIWRLFRVETRVAATLGKLWQTNEAMEYYRYAFGKMNYQAVLNSSEDVELLDILQQASTAYAISDEWSAVRWYQLAMEQEEKLNEYTAIEVERGETLIEIAFRYGCTLEDLRVVNNLGESMVIVRDQQIQVPVLAGYP